MAKNAPAANLPQVSQKGLSELVSRLWFLAIAITVYRIGTHIPVPGINPDRLADLFKQNSDGVLGLFNMFSGGALQRMSIFALGVMPYISSSIIMQLLTSVSPQLEQLKKEGESGRRKISQYTRYGTVVLALVQSTGLAIGMAGQGLAFDPGIMFHILAVTSLVTGAIFMMWLGEQVTERGIGNGISMLIFAGIAAGIPRAILQSVEQARQGELSILALLVIAIIAICLTKARF